MHSPTGYGWITIEGWREDDAHGHDFDVVEETPLVRHFCPGRTMH